MRHNELIDDLTRRDFVARAATGGLAAVLLGAAPLARQLASPAPAYAADPLTDATLQAVADTMIPGRKPTTTDLGDTIDPRAIAGVDDRPGAVEADALAVYRNPKLGFDTLAPPFLADLESRALPAGGPFITLDWDHRVQVCIAGLALDTPVRTLGEAAAAIPFAAFCGAGMAPAQTAAKSSGYRVMGLPGAAPGGYWDASFRRKLSRERTKTGSLD